MTQEYQVEARHFLGYPLAGILQVVRVGNATVPSAMEHADHHIRLLVFLQVIHPIPCTCSHLLESQAAPDGFVQPVGDGRGNHTQDGNLHTLTFQDGIRSHIRLIGFGVNDIGSQHRTFHLTDPFVIDGMSCLHIMVAEGLCVIPHVVDDRSCDVGFVRLDAIIVIADGLTLKDVTVVDEDDVLAIFLPKTVDVSTDSSQTALQGFTLHKAIGKEMSMHVSGFDDSELNGLCLRCHRQGKQQ